MLIYDDKVPQYNEKTLLLRIKKGLRRPPGFPQPLISLCEARLLLLAFDGRMRRRQTGDRHAEGRAA
ncbi:MAG: hypothetical protein LBN04_09770, partial [Oscillospiraceae bacterium]|nr:hypothetical protein [Oscillospiraceae bacterium]